MSVDSDDGEVMITMRCFRWRKYCGGVDGDHGKSAITDMAMVKVMVTVRCLASLQ